MIIKLKFLQSTYLDLTSLRGCFHDFFNENFKDRIYFNIWLCVGHKLQLILCAQLTSFQAIFLLVQIRDEVSSSLILGCLNFVSVSTPQCEHLYTGFLTLYSSFYLV